MGFHNRGTVAVLVIVVSALFIGSASVIALPRKLSQPCDLILELCNKTSYVDTCIATVTENIKGKPTGISILSAEVDASAKATKMALAQVANLSKSAPKQEQQILRTCKEGFESAIYRLADAKIAIAERNATNFNYLVNEMVIYVNTCDNSYAKVSLPSPLTEVDRLLIHLGSNCFAIAAYVDMGVSFQIGL